MLQLKSMEFPLAWRGQFFSLRASTDYTRLTLIEETNLFYSKSTYLNINLTYKHPHRYT